LPAKQISQAMFSYSVYIVCQNNSAGICSIVRKETT